MPVPPYPNRTVIQQGQSHSSALDLILPADRDQRFVPLMSCCSPKFQRFDLFYCDCISEVCFAASSSGPCFHISEETTLSCSKQRDLYKQRAHLLPFPIFHTLPKNLKLSLTPCAFSTCTYRRAQLLSKTQSTITASPLASLPKGTHIHLLGFSNSNQLSYSKDQQSYLP